VKKIGAVTVLYNSESVLDDFFRCFAAQTYKKIVLYIVDNNSPDDSLIRAKKLSKKYKNIKAVFIENSENVGVARGNNQGIKAAIADGCEFILLTNNDIEFDKDVVQKMVEASSGYNRKIVVPKIYYYNTDILWMAGGGFHRLGRHYHTGLDEKDNGQYNGITDITYAPTCFMLIDKCVFDIVGFMDEKYFVYYDDVDYCYRSIKKGVNILYYPDAKIEHKVSTSTGTESDFSAYYIARNSIYCILKNYSLFLKLYLISGLYISHFTKQLILLEKKRWRLRLNAMNDGVKYFFN